MHSFSCFHWLFINHLKWLPQNISGRNQTLTGFNFCSARNCKSAFFFYKVNSQGILGVYFTTVTGCNVDKKDLNDLLVSFCKRKRKTWTVRKKCSHQCWVRRRLYKRQIFPLKGHSTNFTHKFSLLA